MKISARNQLKGQVVDVKTGEVAAQVTLDIGGQTLTASILSESVRDLDLSVGDEVSAVIKASDVMISK
ncbi:MAG: TOBE domain-containing protein [Alphaproteobacteria bacterium]|nr:TOBE domain-containing protein [Alphaproteobacteria bacterium]